MGLSIQGTHLRRSMTSGVSTLAHTNAVLRLFRPSDEPGVRCRTHIAGAVVEPTEQVEFSAVCGREGDPMRKLLAALALAVLMALGTGGNARADNGADWLTAGTGTLICCNQPMVHVNAQSNAGGGNARGHFWIRYPAPGADFGGHVVCLNV